MAKTTYRSSIWSCGDVRIDRAVTKKQFTSSRSHYWWPRRKDEEAGRDAEVDLEGGESIDRLPAEDQNRYPNHVHSRRLETPKRIHILGAGNLGAFVAHSLAGIPNRPALTLLLPPRQLRVWEEYDCSIEITTRGMKEIRRGFQAEAVRQSLGNPSVPVENRYGNGEAMSHDTEAGESESSLPRDSNLKTRKTFDSNAPSPDESTSAADDSHRKDSSCGRTPPKESITEAGRPPTLGTEVSAWFAQAEQDDYEARHKEKDTTGSEQARTPNGREELIYHLIVSVKAPQTVKAIQAVAHRLTQNSSILFLQNGMGMIDEVNEKLFPDQKYRPTYIVGVVSHGLYANRPFSVVHAGEGTIALGVLPRIPMGEPTQLEALNQLSHSARYLMRTMTRTAVFVAVGLSPTDLLQQQLDKLAVNCIINPLTAILDCKNGALLYNFYFTRVVRLLLAEISIVIKSLPELKNVPNVNMRFDTLRLERLVSSIANTTAENYSSMVQDIRTGRPTEVDYINGYIVRRGEEMGIQCVMNYMLMHMVKGKNKNISQEKAALLPLAGQRS